MKTWTKTIRQQKQGKHNIEQSQHLNQGARIQLRIQTTFPQYMKVRTFLWEVYPCRGTRQNCSSSMNQLWCFHSLFRSTFGAICQNTQSWFEFQWKSMTHGKCFVDERLAKLYWTFPHPEAKYMKSDNVPHKFILIQNPNPLRKSPPVQHLESHNSLRNWLHPGRTFGGLCWSWRYLKLSEELGANYPFSLQQSGHRPSKKYIILTIFEGFLVLHTKTHKKKQTYQT